MGFKRFIKVGTLGLALLFVGGVSGAAPAGERLVVTTLPDPEAELIAAGSSGEESIVDGQIKSFSQAINQAAAAERQSIAMRCKSLRVIPAAGAEREAWEANCRYQRR